MNAAGHERVWFDARITPNRSTSGIGLIWIAVGLLAPAVAFGVVSIVIGAWPVTAFLGAEALLAVAAVFGCAKRLSEQGERVVLTDRALTVEAWVHGRTVSTTSLEPTWAHVEREIDDEFGCGAVFVRAQRQRFRIADALSPAERAAFADALESALHHRKSRFARTDI